MAHLHVQGKANPKIINDKPIVALTKETAAILNDAIDYTITDNVLPKDFIQALKNDVYLFSGFKSYAQLKTASELLLDEAGNRKSYAAFKNDIQAIHANYNVKYLEAEYYFAVGSANMASKWNNFDDSDRYLLQYRTAGDSRVRDTHNALRNITLKKQDAFWDKYTPPNGWRCRCDTVEVNAGKYEISDSKDAIAKGELATTQINSKGKNASEIFRFNPGKQKIIFPPTHPYKGDLTKCGIGKFADGQGGQAEK